MRSAAFASVIFTLSAGLAFAQTTEITPPPTAQVAPGESPSALLPALIAHSRHVARLETGRLAGEGADFLRTLGAESQFVLIGEDHGSAGIADFIGAYWRDLAETGYAYAAIEVDPWMARALERELRAGGVAGWTAYLAQRGGATSAPFFTWASEARLAQTIVEAAPERSSQTLWGLDQVFLGAAPSLLRDIAESARDREARLLAARLAGEAAAGGMDWLGRSDAQPLIDLRAHLGGRQDRDEAALIDAMLVSQRIYRPFTGGGGEAYLANLERETQMKTLFLDYYRAAERADGAAPRVMLKFGSYHMYRGATPTHVQGLGGFVSEFAAQNGARALSIATLCGPGGAVSSFDRGATPCTEPFNQTYAFLAPFVEADALTIFDLRVWRLRPRRWEHLPANIRQMIDSFDILVVVPNGPAADYLPGLTPTRD